MLEGVRTIDRAAQLAVLDQQRAVVANKLGGLTREQAEQVRMPSGTTLSGLVHHLTLCEIEWFQQIVAGAEVELPDDGDEWFVAGTGSVEDLLDAYREACDQSRRIVERCDFADESIGAHPYFGRCEVGWVVLHMIRRTPRDRTGVQHREHGGRKKVCGESVYPDERVSCKSKKRISAFA